MRNTALRNGGLRKPGWSVFWEQFSHKIQVGKNVEKALSNLNLKGKMYISILGDIEIGELAQLIRPSGYFNQKAKKNKEFCEIC